MKAGEGTNHEDSGSETLPESIESNISVDLLDLGTGTGIGGSLVEDGDHSVSWMRHDGAEDSSNVSGHEGDHELGGLVVVGFTLGEDIAVESSDDSLESDELDDGVWHLSAPEWGESLVESVDSFGGLDLVESGNGVFGEGTWLGSLHSDFELYLKTFN